VRPRRNHRPLSLRLVCVRWEAPQPDIQVEHAGRLRSGNGAPTIKRSCASKCAERALLQKSAGERLPVQSRCAGGDEAFRYARMRVPEILSHPLFGKDVASPCPRSAKERGEGRRMLGMLKRHEFEILLKAGHSKTRPVQQTDRILPVVPGVGAKLAQDRFLALSSCFLIPLIIRSQILPPSLVTQPFLL
jgi:hypothetical protein